MHLQSLKRCPWCSAEVLLRKSIRGVKEDTKIAMMPCLYMCFVWGILVNGAAIMLEVNVRGGLDRSLESDLLIYSPAAPTNNCLHPALC
jgi:hypothetical protein